jgi:hypothetical protein
MSLDRIAINNNVIVMSDWGSGEVLNTFCDIMNQSRPLFFSRIGGSDYNCVRDYFNNNDIINDLHWYKNELYSVKSHNGYFDFENKQENFTKYLEAMIESYQNSDAFMYGNGRLISSFDSNQFLPNDAIFVNHLCKNKVCINYSFIEGLAPFLKSFDRWARGKKILVVSPLSASIEHQYKNRDSLYRNYRFPDIDLLTYNTKITYSDEGDHPSILNVTTSNWLKEAECMAEEISKINFDIALLSCGSYAMYLGNFIKNNLGKKSLYVGGALNMIFNIYGGRYNHPGYRRLTDSVGLIPESQINPIENKDIKHMKSGRNFKSESLNAYFGVKLE